MAKKSEVFSALNRLMQEPGDRGVIFTSLLRSAGLNTIDNQAIKELVERHPEMGDREAVIVFSALVEHALEAALMTHFVVSGATARALFSYTDDGALSSFNAKIAMGLALGLYEEHMHSDLKWIARIRNAFAHARINVTFKTSEIAAACEQLKPHAFHSWSPTDTPNYHRQTFNITILLLATYLNPSEDETSFALRYIDNKKYPSLYRRSPTEPPG